MREKETEIRDFNKFHFVYSIGFIQNRALWTLLPLARALLDRQMAVLWQSLAQSAGLLAVLLGLAVLEWRAAGWCRTPDRMLRLRGGLLVRWELVLPADRLAGLAVRRPPWLRLLGGAALTVYPGQGMGPVTLYLTPAATEALAEALLPEPGRT